MGSEVSLRLTNGLVSRLTRMKSELKVFFMFEHKSKKGSEVSLRLTNGLVSRLTRMRSEFKAYQWTGVKANKDEK